MIDINREQLRTFTQAANTLPDRPNVATLWRWRTAGCRGVKLETVLVGGKRYTSLRRSSGSLKRRLPRPMACRLRPLRRANGRRRSRRRTRNWRLTAGELTRPRGDEKGRPVASGSGQKTKGHDMEVSHDPPSKSTAPTPDVVALADVAAEQVDWLWPSRVAIGKVTLIAGNPGLGKSFLTIDIAARVSRGRSWPDSPQQEQPAGGVVLLSAEDDLADTIRPRLNAHDADVQRIVALRGINGADAAGDYRRMFDLSRDLEHLSAAIDGVENCRLLIVDPISAYLGRTDSHKNSDVRAVLAPLAELASEKRVAVLAVSHLRKGEGQAIYRTMGSLAFVAAARACWVVTEDPAVTRRRLLLPTKNNLAPDVQGLAFSIEPHGLSEGPAVCWEAEPVAISADEAMMPKRSRPTHTARDEAAEWLRKELADGPQPAKQVIKAGIKVGFSKRTLHRALELVGGVSRREGFPATAIWSLDSRANNNATDPRDWHGGTSGTTGTTEENPREEVTTTMFRRNGNPVVPTYEARARLDVNAALAECDGDGEIPF